MLVSHVCTFPQALFAFVFHIFLVFLLYHHCDRPSHVRLLGNWWLPLATKRYIICSVWILPFNWLRLLTERDLGLTYNITSGVRFAVSISTHGLLRPRSRGWKSQMWVREQGILNKLDKHTTRGLLLGSKHLDCRCQTEISQSWNRWLRHFPKPVSTIWIPSPRVFDTPARRPGRSSWRHQRCLRHCEHAAVCRRYKGCRSSTCSEKHHDDAK